MVITNELLMAYADGQLPPEQVLEIEAALAASEDLRTIVDGYRKTALAARMAFEGVLREPVPDRILSLFDRQPQAEIIRPSFARRPNPMLALAASLGVLAAGLGLALIWQGRSTTGPRIAEPVTEGLAAPGALASALETLGARQMLRSPAGERITPVVTYPQKGGGWCREYRMTGQAAVGSAGIACRDMGAAGWQIVVHLPWTPPASVADRDFVPSGPAPEAVDAVAERRQGGTPLTAVEESTLIARGWRAQ